MSATETPGVTDIDVSTNDMDKLRHIYPWNGTLEMVPGEVALCGHVNRFRGTAIPRGTAPRECKECVRIEREADRP